MIVSVGSAPLYFHKPSLRIYCSRAREGVASGYNGVVWRRLSHPVLRVKEARSKGGIWERDYLLRQTALDTLAVVEEGKSNNCLVTCTPRASVEVICVKTTPFKSFSRDLGRFERRRKNGI